MPRWAGGQNAGAAGRSLPLRGWRPGGQIAQLASDAEALSAFAPRRERSLRPGLGLWRVHPAVLRRACQLLSSNGKGRFDGARGLGLVEGAPCGSCGAPVSYFPAPGRAASIGPGALGQWSVHPEGLAEPLSAYPAPGRASSTGPGAAGRRSAHPVSPAARLSAFVQREERSLRWGPGLRVGGVCTLRVLRSPCQLVSSAGKGRFDGARGLGSAECVLCQAAEGRGAMLPSARAPGGPVGAGGAGDYTFRRPARQVGIGPPRSSKVGESTGRTCTDRAPRFARVAGNGPIK